MNLRTITIAACVVVLAVPAAAFAASSRAPVETPATWVAGGQDAGTDAAGLRARIHKAERYAAVLRARLRGIQTGSAAIRAELRATQRLVATLRDELDAALAALSRKADDDTPRPDPDPIDYCRSNMVDCTDRQLCEYWGMNCWLVEQPLPAAAPEAIASERSASDG